MKEIIMSTSTLISLLVICGLNICVKSSPIVEIKNGLLEGTIMQSRYGREFFSFQGIPYAIPPLGELRFELPQPALSWTGIRQSIKVPPKCTQKDVFTNQKIVDGQEDCLYLNVYTPELKNSDGKKLPVMVWIHGGAFISGQGFVFGPKYLLDHNIVLVTFNYRLGSIGFLSTGDMVSPGNIGMKDQVLALKWVQENIAAFGGDPNSVTIFGESAGGASTHYHMLSPLSKGLFHRVISQSGAASVPWAFDSRNFAKQHSQLLAQHFGCHTNDSIQIISCLRKIDAAELIEAEKIFQTFGYDPVIPFRIVDEPNHSEAFINDLPLNIVKSGNISDVPWMTGITSHEGAIRAAALLHGFGERSYVKQLNDNWLELGPSNLLLNQVFSYNIPAGVVEKIRQFYFGDKTIDESSKWALIDMYTDFYLAYGIDQAVQYHLEFNYSPIYYYEFAYKGTTSFSTIFGDPEGTYGVCHADDLLYLFPIGEIISPKNVLTENDHKIIDFLTTAWYNFAKTGNPTPQDTSVEWKPVTTKAHEYLFIENPQNIKMLSNLNKKRIEFLRSLFNQSENLNEKISNKDEL